MPDSPIANVPDRHAFVMAGTETLFLDHLPMFNVKEHMYQVILKGTLPDYAMKQYAADRKEHPESTYLLANVEYDLMTLPQIQNRQMTSFVADVFRGIPQDPPLIHNVRTYIDRIVYYRPFNLAMEHPKALSYVVFGSGQEAHMSHHMIKQPDFQQVLDLAELPTWIPPLQLEAGFLISIPALPNKPADKPTYCSNPLTDNSYDVQFQGQEGQKEEDPLKIQVGTSYYFDTAALNIPDNPCAQ